MNPNFALDFRNDQIKLLHLQEGAWIQIGIVAVDDPDLEPALSYMRSTALGLSPRGIASKLILPDAAILYTTLSNLSIDAKTRATQIALALVGRTPYAVAELVYDWADDRDKAHLVVIARETLDEAEAFANQHRFNPVAFAAWPEQSHFPTEADFGPSANAPETIAPILATVAPSDATALSARDFEMGDTPAADVMADDRVSMAASDELAPPEGDLALAISEQSTQGDLPPDQDAPDLSETMIDVAETRADTSPAGNDARQDVLADQDPDIVELADVAGSNAVHADEAPPYAAEQIATETVHAGSDLAKSEPAAPAQPDLFAPAPNFAPSFAASFSDVMAQEADEAPMALDVPIDESIDEDPKPNASRNVAPPVTAPVAPPVGPAVSPAVSPSAGKAQTLLAEFSARREAALGKSDSAGRMEPKISADKKASPAVAQPEIRAEAVPKPAIPSNQIPLRTTNASLGSKPSIKRPAPKARSSRSALMGFVLTILLLIALAAAAAMSSYLTTAWNSYGASTDVAANQPSVPDEVAADLSDRAEISVPPALLTPDLAVQTALPDPVNLPMPSLTSQSQGSLVPLVTPAALPQPAAVAPPNIMTASADLPTAPLITPTAQGVMTPEGVFLIAGRPTVLPNTRPENVVSAALQRPAVADILPSSGAVFADPALAGKTPQFRPAGLAPQIATAPLTNDPALVDKRPLERPETVLAAANSAQIALASLAQSGVESQRSTLAVTISRLPAARPRNLDTTVAAPQLLALATPEQVIPEAITPDLAPHAGSTNLPLEADNEPEVVAPKSSGSRTVVSRNATFRNAINLSRVNLIGVYGSQANRYALIRQSNGRFKKVYVGDRFDGGLVAAITESELRYSKGGQMLALQMPNG